MILKDVFLLKNFQIISESKENKTLKIRGTFQRADEANANKRIYPKTVLESNVKRLQPLIENRALLGELDHPELEATRLSNAAVLITKLGLKGNEVIGEAEILNTPGGKIVKTLIEDKVTIGISSRGVGNLLPEAREDGVKYVSEDYKLITFYIVADPSTRGAYPQVCESKEQKYLDNVIKKAFGEEILIALTKDMISSPLNEAKKGLKHTQRVIAGIAKRSDQGRDKPGDNELFYKKVHRQTSRDRRRGIVPDEEGAHKGGGKSERDHEVDPSTNIKRGRFHSQDEAIQYYTDLICEGIRKSKIQVGDREEAGDDEGGYARAFASDMTNPQEFSPKTRKRTRSEPEDTDGDDDGTDMKEGSLEPQRIFNEPKPRPEGSFSRKQRDTRSMKGSRLYRKLKMKKNAELLKRNMQNKNESSLAEGVRDEYSERSERESKASQKLKAMEGNKKAEQDQLYINKTVHGKDSPNTKNAEKFIKHQDNRRRLLGLIAKKYKNKNESTLDEGERRAVRLDLSAEKAYKNAQKARDEKKLHVRKHLLDKGDKLSSMAKREKAKGMFRKSFKQKDTDPLSSEKNRRIASSLMRYSRPNNTTESIVNKIMEGSSGKKKLDRAISSVGKKVMKTAPFTPERGEAASKIKDLLAKRSKKHKSASDRVKSQNPGKSSVQQGIEPKGWPGLKK